MSGSTGPVVPPGPVAVSAGWLLDGVMVQCTTDPLGPKLPTPEIVTLVAPVVDQLSKVGNGGLEQVPTPGAAV